MKKIEKLRDLQLAETYILNELNNVCSKLGLKLYLLGGTLIGAVRHKGFIPWDDDIDVCMSRIDYERLLQCTKGKIGEKCSIIDPASDTSFKGYIPLCVFDDSKLASKQFRGNEELKLSVSIFIYDGAPESKFAQQRYYRKMYFLRAKHALCRADFKNVNTKLARLFGPILQPFFSERKVYKYKEKILHMQKRYPFESSKLVCTNADNNSIKEIASKESFLKSVPVVFEGLNLLAFSHYKEHLTNYYGDYMKLPPLDQQIQKHSFDAMISDDFDFSWNSDNR